ncbi:MAG: trigger factor, partial [Deltaproteobacteria bacterium]|nr:trigger factor [Deltaproteobacteria bacterium]
MQVLVTDEGKLKRRVSIEVPLTEVESAYEEVYGQIQKKLKVDGFRPGKFPRELAEKRFKALMQQEAGRNLVPKYLERALKEKNLRPATQPEFHNLEVDRKKPLKFEVAFEVIPDFELLPYSAFQVKLEEARVEPRAVEDRIAEMRNAKATLEDKGDLEAQTGDRVTFDFHATHEGQPVDKIHGHGQKLEVGGGKFLEAFEAQLPGVKAGQEKTFDLVLPENFDEPSLVGKTIQIRMNVSQVEKKVPPPMDESFFSQVSEAKD